MPSSVLLDRLIESLQIMPGVGPVSAARIAYALLDRPREQGLRLSEAIREALTRISLCPVCRDYCDDSNAGCELCRSAKRRARGELCVVETSSEARAIERSGSFFGTYFILHGHLSPLDGVGIREIGLDRLGERFRTEHFNEVILALSRSVEGEATSAFIAAMCRRRSIRVTAIATGVPLGGDLNSVDENTLSSSFNFRRPYEG